jgi:rRNA maturation endonuclease Nob1
MADVTKATKDTSNIDSNKIPTIRDSTMILTTRDSSASNQTTPAIITKVIKEVIKAAAPKVVVSKVVAAAAMTVEAPHGSVISRHAVGLMAAAGIPEPIASTN